MRLGQLAFLLCISGCTSWGGGRPLEAVPMPLGERDRYVFWAHGESYALHAIRIDGDTLRGIPYWKDPTCDSCQIAIPRLAIDSVQVRTYDGGRTGILLSIVIPFLILTWYAAHIPST